MIAINFCHDCHSADVWLCCLLLFLLTFLLCSLIVFFSLLEEEDLIGQTLFLGQPVSSPLFCADRRTGGSAPRRRGGTREGFDRAEEAARARGCWVFFNIFAFCSTNRRGWTLHYPGKGYRVTPPTSLKDKFASAEFLVLPYSPKSICAIFI